MIGNWRAYLYDKSDVFVAELPFEGLRIEYVLNNIWTAEIRVNYLVFKRQVEKQNTTVANVLTAGFRYVDIQRKLPTDTNYVTQFKGILCEPALQRFETDVNVTLSFKSWLAYFTRRYITKTYTATDAGAIAWDMINIAQLVTYGDIGVTQGTIDTTVNRDLTRQRDEIAASIIHLSNDKVDGGYEFEITNSKVLTVKSRLGSDRPEIVFDDANIRHWRFSYFVGLSLTNKVHTLGEGFGSDQLVEVRDASNTYKDKWYLLEKTASFLSVSKSDTLQDHGDRILALDQDVRTEGLHITVDTGAIDPTTYNTGDGVKVIIENIISGLYRIRRKIYNVSEKDEFVELEVF
jgi:hypothetical protein